MIEYMLTVFDVSVINAAGDLVLQQQLIGSTSGLDIRHLTAGVYIITVFSEGELKSRKTIVKRDL